jgi:glycosyltransferase involved in cell wall biosynthesis
MNKQSIKLPKISIITVVLNNEKTINKCIKSVINQSYPSHKIEHIIIDGGSTDKTVLIIKKYQKKISYWHTKKDAGLYDAMNIGLRKCTGNIIGILNSDDFFNKNALKTVSKYFRNHQIDFLFGSVMKNRVYHNFFPNRLWYTFNIYPSHSVGFFITNKAQKKIGNYNTKFKYSADRDLIYRLIKKHRLKGLPTKKKDVLGTFSLKGLSSRLSFAEKTLEEIRIRMSNKQNMIQIISITIVFLVYYFFKLFQTKKIK